MVELTFDVEVWATGILHQLFENSACGTSLQSVLTGSIIGIHN